MNNEKLIGVGAAGNKAVITAIEMGTIDRSKCLLINSTEKDIPQDYRDIACIIGNVSGAGKESKLGAQMMKNALDEQEELFGLLQDFLSENDDSIIIVHSDKGGTGCGGAPVLSDFIQENIGITVHEFVLMGDNSDARGLSNTIGLFKQFRPEYVVHTLSNAKFSEEANGNKVMAEQLCNKVFAEQVSIISGSILREGSQNIDDTDHFKLINNPGYTLIETSVIGRDIKTKEQLDKLLAETLRNTKSIDIETPACRRIGIIWTVTEATKSIIDYDYKAIKAITGEPYEVFEHIQEPLDDKQTVTIVVAGLKLPLKEMLDTYEEYKKISSNVNKDADSFYDELNSLSIEDDEFNVKTTPKSKFFNKKSQPKQQQKPTTADQQMQAVLRKVQE